ncbi:uracil-DNA glycosylase [Legionella impletisoli]|uniref:Uracil-DNA glycosylase n=1 Tax=Legionella impletisoli TaxID=343510 RepID=A0A917N8C3_9GAMM|nr:uracil-DNA glycosylase [Legionella impletisoli]GGI75771.1 uracil-DNA glycosylase [Legionella impletisoli]
MNEFIKAAHPEWYELLTAAFKQMDQDYLQWLRKHDDWLPGKEQLLNAFSLPLSSSEYILFGESPYPREQSANGYAFWDDSVESIWSDTGFSKKVNRATSLRNFLKMLLHARGDLRSDFSQDAIAKLDHSKYVQTAQEFFERLISKGFLLLNATLVYSEGKVNYHARKWQPFMHFLLSQLAEQKPSVQLVLFGRIAKQLPEIKLFPHIIAEHPYNVSFVTNEEVMAFFKPLELLVKHDESNHD